MITCTKFPTNRILLLPVSGWAGVVSGWAGVASGWGGVASGWAGVASGWAGVVSGWAGVGAGVASCLTWLQSIHVFSVHFIQKACEFRYERVTDI